MKINWNQINAERAEIARRNGFSSISHAAGAAWWDTLPETDRRRVKELAIAARLAEGMPGVKPVR